jgi:hypothetical protein
VLNVATGFDLPSSLAIELVISNGPLFTDAGSNARHYVPVDRIGEALVVVAGGDPASGALYLHAGVAHHDAQPGVGEHEHVVGHVADGGDLFGRDVVPGRLWGSKNLNW